MFHEAATARVTALHEQLTVAEGFADSLAGHLDARR
jgi:MerR family transcriptional regulator, copper efflux regulator